MTLCYNLSDKTLGIWHLSWRFDIRGHHTLSKLSQYLCLFLFFKNIRMGEQIHFREAEHIRDRLLLDPEDRIRV